ncbi:unnamed protein product [Urochloa humidicola]
MAMAQSLVPWLPNRNPNPSKSSRSQQFLKAPSTGGAARCRSSPVAVQVCRMSADTNARAGSVERRRRVPVPPPGPAAGPGLPGTRGAGPPPLPRGAHDMTLANILAAGGSGTKEGDVLAATYSKYGDNGSSVC